MSGFAPRASWAWLLLSISYACAESTAADIDPPSTSQGSANASGGASGGGSGGSSSGGKLGGGGSAGELAGSGGSAGSIGGSGGSAGSVANGGAAGAGQGSGGENEGGAPGGAGGALGGAGGTPGSAGEAGSAGSAGSAGTSGAGGAGGSVCAGAFTLETKSNSTNASEFQYSYKIINVSGGTISAGQVEVRFFISNEETSGWNFAVYDADRNANAGTAGPSGAADIPTGQVLSSLETLSPSAGGQDRYFKFDFTSSVSYAQGDYLFFNGAAQPVNWSAPNQDKSDDFSTLGGSTFAATTSIGVYVDGVLQGGCEPAD
jgi:hypothetical protein